MTERLRKKYYQKGERKLLPWLDKEVEARKANELEGQNRQNDSTVGDDHVNPLLALKLQRKGGTIQLSYKLLLCCAKWDSLSVKYHSENNRIRLRKMVFTL